MQRYLGALATLALAALVVAAPARAGAHDDEFPWLSERKILGANNLEPVEAAKPGALYDWSLVVARVEVKNDGYGYCTGARVGANLFLTNYHCDHGCETMQFRMGYEQDVGSADRTVYACKRLLRKNETLDYALFEVTPPPSGAELQYPILTLWKGPLTEGTKLVVASHPSGKLKVIDRSDECVLSSTEVFRTESGRDTVKHMCDTEGGSSGAPVIDRERGFGVGIHWGGKDREFNYAVPMYLILEDIQANVTADVYLGLHVAE